MDCQERQMGPEWPGIPGYCVRRARFRHFWQDETGIRTFWPEMPSFEQLEPRIPARIRSQRCSMVPCVTAGILASYGVYPGWHMGTEQYGCRRPTTTWVGNWVFHIRTLGQTRNFWPELPEFLSFARKVALLARLSQNIGPNLS